MARKKAVPVNLTEVKTRLRRMAEARILAARHGNAVEKATYLVAAAALYEAVDKVTVEMCAGMLEEFDEKGGG